jgi:VCBS repeat-containing protein
MNLFRAKIHSHCIKRFLSVGLILVVSILFSEASLATGSGRFSTYTGGAAGAACTGCHTGATSSNTGYSIRLYKNSRTAGNRLLDTSDTLSKNVTTPIIAYLVGTGAENGGFNLKTSTGTFANPLSGDIQTGGTPTDTEATHTNGPDAGGGKDATNGDVEWTIDYAAPNSVTTTTFNICGNPVDGDGVDDAQDGPAQIGMANQPPICAAVTVSIVNDPPVADAETTNGAENSTVNITYATLLTGDTDVNGDSLSVTGFDESATTGDVTDNVSFFTYDPNGQYEHLDSGDNTTEDTFTYTVSDGILDTTGTVTVTILGANDPPVAIDNTVTVDIAGTAMTVVEGGSTSVLTNDTDADDGEAVKQAFLVTPPSNHDTINEGAFVLATDGTFSYTHDGTAAPSDTFTYRVWDGTEFSGNATVTITVSNTAPTANDDLLVDTVAEGGSVTFTVLDNDTDPETSATAVVGISNEIGGTATVELDQSVTFMHDGTESPASFEYLANDGFLDSLASALVTLTVTPVNDPPVIGDVVDFNSTEGVPMNIDLGNPVPDPDNPNDGIAVDRIVWSFVSGQEALMNLTSTGVFTWTPPLGPAGVFGQTYPVEIQADDGEYTDTELFTITVNPPDSDTDMVADYLDLCVTMPSVNFGENFDNDLDGLPGTDGDATHPLGIPGSGGDVCDNDDDNDGMLDVFEIASSLDPFNFADAALDADGDGVTNLQEFLDGTNPNLANLSIDATGYLTPYDLVFPTPTSIHASATAVTPVFVSLTPVSDSPTGPYRPGDNSIEWVPSNATDPDLRNNPGLVSDPPQQPLFVRPLVNFGVNQQVEENDSADITVTVSLNGDSPSWPANPATVNFSVSGTANNPADHNAVAVPLDFDNGIYQRTITFRAFNDAIADPNETVVFTLTNASNAVIGSKNTHTVTIIEDNVAPRVALLFSRNGVAVGSTYAGDGGVITIDAIASDVNSAQIPTLSYDWSGSDNVLVPPIATNMPNWAPLNPAVGSYLVDVVVTDSGAASTRISRILHVASGTSPGDLTDFDGDGIPSFRDADDASLTDGNLIPDQTVDLSETLFLETETGLTLRRGSTTLAANRFGALLTPNDIESFGSVNGTAPLNAEDDFVHVGGIYDFEIHGLIPGSSARIVIPLQSAIPKNAVYRKFNPSTGWSNFVIDNNNSIASAVGDLGACPEPGSSAYHNGLQYLDNCIQLIIQDGGPNDTDNTVNGVINDPATVGVALKDPQLEEVEDGSGRVSPLLLAILLSLGGLVFWRRRRGFDID